MTGYLLTILAALLIIEGLPYFAFPGKAKEWGRFLQEMDEKSLRLIGLVCVAAGLIILYLVRRF
jgi:hypothetical protein